MAQKRFSDRYIGSLKAKPGRYEVFEPGTGFGIRVSPRGVKTWVYMYRYDGKARRMTLGRYAQKTKTDSLEANRPLSLADARIAYANARKLLDEGTDPGSEAVEQRQQERSADTVTEFIGEYLANGAPERSKAEYERVLRKELEPRWGRRKAGSIKRADAQKLLREIRDRGADVAANRTMAYARSMYTWGIKELIVSENPFSGLNRTEEEERDRIYSSDEIRALWKAFDVECGDVFKLILVLGQRVNEVIGMSVSELDLEAEVPTWTVPAARMKSKKPHVVPLPPIAVEIVEGILSNIGENGLLFESDRRPGRARSSLKTPIAEVREAAGVNDFRTHDLRRTCGTGVTKAGFSRFIMDRVLGHVEPGVGRAYDRYDYFAEKTDALNAWADELQTILKRTPKKSGTAPNRTGSK